MEAVFTYLAKSGALIAMFWLGYYFLLRKETFFRSNRWYLLMGLATSMVLPLITFKKVIWIESSPNNIDWAAISAAQIASPETVDFNMWLLLCAVYLLGIMAFLRRFFLDFYALRKALKGKPVTQRADFKFVDTSENISPFSYFSYIVYNSSLYSEEELQNILAHEKVHSDQRHSIDVLIMRFFCIIFWFNPFIWFYKQSILQNLEFIADSGAATKILDRKSYQMTLLKVTAHENCVDITNHFYQSLIKKRIVMLNKNQSRKWHSWKYVLIVPALAAFMFYFQVKVIAQEKEMAQRPAMAKIAQNESDVRVVINKNTTDAEMKSESERVKKWHGITLKFSKIKRNSAGEITAIKAEFIDKEGKKGVTQIVDDKPIRPISFYKSENGTVGFGNSRDLLIVNRNGVDESEERYAYSTSSDDADFEFDSDVPDAPEPPELPAHGKDIAAPRILGHPKIARDVMITKHGDGHPVVIIDGEVMLDGEKIMRNLDPATIEKMDVIKGDMAKKYSKDGKDVIIIDTKKIEKEAMRGARGDIDRARPQIERAIREVERAKIDIEKSEINKVEMEEARKELEQDREELKKTKFELDKQRAALDKERSERKK